MKSYHKNFWNWDPLWCYFQALIVTAKYLAIIKWLYSLCQCAKMFSQFIISCDLFHSITVHNIQSWQNFVKLLFSSTWWLLNLRIDPKCPSYLYTEGIIWNKFHEIFVWNYFCLEIHPNFKNKEGWMTGKFTFIWDILKLSKSSSYRSNNFTKFFHDYMLQTVQWLQIHSHL